MDDSSEELRIDEIGNAYLEELRAGNKPLLEQYVAAYPELAPRLQQILETLRYLEERQEKSSKASKRSSSSLPEIADFEISRRLGAGGMGVVYKANQISLGRDVALKVVPEFLLDNEIAIKRFEFEGRVAAQLQHPNIVPIFEVGRTETLHFFTMQLIRGAGLDRLIEKLHKRRMDAKSRNARWDTSILRFQDELPDRTTSSIKSDNTRNQTLSARSTLSQTRSYYQQVAAIGRDIASALAHAHAKGILHRDIKPSNLILDRDGKIWLTDFGLAKTEDSNLTQTGDVVGTLRFMAPERIDGLCDRRSDIYSLGMTLYELVSLQPAFYGGGKLSIVRSIKESNPIALSILDRSVPRDLQTIVEKSIAKDPNDRYLTAEAMSDDLRCFIEGLPIRARPTGRLDHVLRWSKRNRSLSGLIATLALMLIVGFVGSTWAAFQFRATAIKQSLLTQRAVVAENDALENEQRAVAASEENRSNLYSAEMRLALSASLRPSGQARLLELLGHWQGPEHRDLRGFEFDWLSRLAREKVSEIATLPTDSYGIVSVQHAISHHPSDSMIASGRDQTIRLVSTQLKEVVASELMNSTARIQSVDYSGDGSRIAVTQLDGTVTILSSESLKTLAQTNIPYAKNTCWTGNDFSLIVVSVNEEGSKGNAVVVLNPDDLRIRQDQIPNFEANSMRLTRFAQLDAAGETLWIPSDLFGWTGLLEFTNAPATSPSLETEKDKAFDPVEPNPFRPWRLSRRIPVDDFYVGAMVYDEPNERMYLAHSNHRLSILDIHSGESIETVSITNRVNSLLIDPRSGNLVAGNDGGDLVVRDPKSLKRLSHLFYHSKNCGWLHWDAAVEKLLSFATDGHLVEWDESKLAMHSVQCPPPVPTVEQYRIEWSPDDQFVALGFRAPMSVLSATDMKEINLTNGDEPLFAEPLGWLSDNQLVAHYEDEIFIVEVPGGRVTRTIHSEDVVDGKVRERTRVYDRNLLLIQREQYHEWGLLRLNLDTVQVQTITAMQPGRIFAMPSLQRSKQIAITVSDGASTKLHRFSIDDFEIQSGGQHKPISFCVSINPKEPHQIAISQGPELVIEDTRSNEIVARFGGHSSTIRALDWSPDGRRLVTGGNDRQVIVWDASDQRAVLAVEATDRVVQVAFSNDGKRLAYSTANGKTTFLSTDPPVDELNRQP